MSDVKYREGKRRVSLEELQIGDMYYTFATPLGGKWNKYLVQLDSKEPAETHAGTNAGSNEFAQTQKLVNSYKITFTIISPEVENSSITSPEVDGNNTYIIPEVVNSRSTSQYVVPKDIASRSSAKKTGLKTIRKATVPIKVTGPTKARKIRRSAWGGKRNTRKQRKLHR